MDKGLEYTFPQRQYTNPQYAYKNMLNITNQGNANKSHNETLLHFHQDGYCKICVC